MRSTDLKAISMTAYLIRILPGWPEKILITSYRNSKGLIEDSIRCLNRSSDRREAILKALEQAIRLGWTTNHPAYPVDVQVQVGNRRTGLGSGHPGGPGLHPYLTTITEPSQPPCGQCSAYQLRAQIWPLGPASFRPPSSS